MNQHEFINLLNQGKRRWHRIGTKTDGVIVALDLEGRLFTILDGMVVNRVNRAVILGRSPADEYPNPGGDGLWPGPEGTCFGYEYATGKWRVPPSITGARYQIGLDPRVAWIEYRSPALQLRVRRTAALPPPGQGFIDIADAPPQAQPSDRKTRYSICSDPRLFMELEVVGGSPEHLRPGDALTLDVVTTYTRL